MSGNNKEHQKLLKCKSELVSLLKHSLPTCSRLLEEGLVSEDVSEWVTTAQGASYQEKATRVVSCVTDQVKVSAQRFYDFVDVLKENPFFTGIVKKLCGM